ncbi:MAG: glutamate--tRNA ligase, partial [Clostridia bacterium]|nr:glutamate--tRNA ligase [Clostridia bacterium]
LATFDIADDMNTWFEKIKAIAREIGYADDMKAYKASPEEYRGSIADVSMFLRVAVTGKMNAPDLYTVMQILGKCNTVCRIESMIERLD